MGSFYCLWFVLAANLFLILFALKYDLGVHVKGRVQSSQYNCWRSNSWEKSSYTCEVWNTIFYRFRNTGTPSKHNCLLYFMISGGEWHDLKLSFSLYLQLRRDLPIIMELLILELLCFVLIWMMLKGAKMSKSGLVLTTPNHELRCLKVWIPV